MIYQYVTIGNPIEKQLKSAQINGNQCKAIQNQWKSMEKVSSCDTSAKIRSFHDAEIFLRSDKN